MSTATVDLTTVPSDFVESVELLRQARDEVKRLQEHITPNTLTVDGVVWNENGVRVLYNKGKDYDAFRDKVRREIVSLHEDANIDTEEANEILDRLDLEKIVTSWIVRVPYVVTFRVSAADEDSAKDEARWMDLSDAEDSEADYYGIEVEPAD